MTIALICNREKQTLLLNFAKAYHSVLSKHKVISSDFAAEVIEQNCPVQVSKLTALQGHSSQLISPKIACGEIDMLIFFKGEVVAERADLEMFGLCDRYNIPYATNLASAEILIKSLIK